MTDIESAQHTLLLLLPELILLVAATAMMTAGPFVKHGRAFWAGIAALVMTAATVALLTLRPDGRQFGSYFYGSVAIDDSFAFFSRLVFLLTGLIVLGMAHDQVEDSRAPEFFGSLLFINAGAMLVSSANELVFLFVGLELVSMPTYLLLYLSRRDAQAQEAATKYFFLSIFSSGLLLFGLAYLYGMTGISNLKALSFLAQFPGKDPGFTNPTVGLIALVFVMAGLGFRVAAVPFHFYAPDVYQGAPTIVTAMLAWVPKGIGFVAILRALTAVIPTDVPPPGNNLTLQAVYLSGAIATVTMILGNTVALAQTNLKRLFAYSSIAHAGYLMIGVTVAFRNGGSSAALITTGSASVLFYLVTYALMTLGAFAVIIALGTPERPVETIEDVAGLARTRPLMAASMAICLFSLAGIPPFAGFVGKFNLFVAAFSASNDDDAPIYRTLAIIGVINSAIGAYYYLKIVVAMYYREPSGPTVAPRPIPWPTAASLSTCVALTVLLGLYAKPLYSAADSSAMALMDHPAPKARLVAVEETPADTDPTTEARLKAEREAESRRGIRWAPPVRKP